MKLSLLLLALGAIPSLASPLPISEDLVSDAEPALIFERQSAARTCGGHTYSKQDQEDAYNQGKAHEGNPIKAKNGRKYPEPFKNMPEKITFHDCPGESAPFREFPILRSGFLFQKGLDQGPDRVVYKDTGSGYKFCGVMTHTGAPTKNGFIQCN